MRFLLILRTALWSLGRSKMRTRRFSPGAASPFSSHALSMVKEWRPGTLSTRSETRSMAVASKLLVKRREKMVCMLRAMGKPSGERASPGAKVFSIRTGA